MVIEDLEKSKADLEQRIAEVSIFLLLFKKKIE